MNGIKLIIKQTPFHAPLRALLDRWTKFKWEMRGKPLPPPHVIKHLAIQRYAKRYGLRAFVETGTFHGDTLEEMMFRFDVLYSIELSVDLHRKAVQKFARFKHIVLIQGDSGVRIKSVLDDLNQPALFWLDSHYSSGETAKGNTETPIMEELKSIFRAKDRGHVIIIDDARFFGTNPDYPTIEELGNYVQSMRPTVEISVEDDMIVIIPHVAQ